MLDLDEDIDDFTAALIEAEEELHAGASKSSIPREQSQSELASSVEPCEYEQTAPPVGIAPPTQALAPTGAQVPPPPPAQQGPRLPRPPSPRGPPPPPPPSQRRRAQAPQRPPLPPQRPPPPQNEVTPPLLHQLHPLPPPPPPALPPKLSVQLPPLTSPAKEQAPASSNGLVVVQCLPLPPSPEQSPATIDHIPPPPPPHKSQSPHSVEQSPRHSSPRKGAASPHHWDGSAVTVNSAPSKPLETPPRLPDAADKCLGPLGQSTLLAQQEERAPTQDQAHGPPERAPAPLPSAEQSQPNTEQTHPYGSYTVACDQGIGKKNRVDLVPSDGSSCSGTPPPRTCERPAPMRSPQTPPGGTWSDEERKQFERRRWNAGSSSSHRTGRYEDDRRALRDARILFKQNVVRSVKDELKPFYAAGRITSKEDFKFLAKKISKKVQTKEGSKAIWNSRVGRRVEKYVRGTFRQNFVYARPAGEPDI
mmetsp:Transcript_5544/g.17042  ORF Transcript_5544/g.17042 Transcript_5544/m.17042 type:complete len:477 (-) Transcript_5544:303-1733(-)